MSVPFVKENLVDSRIWERLYEIRERCRAREEVPCTKLGKVEVHLVACEVDGRRVAGDQKIVFVSVSSTGDETRSPAGVRVVAITQ